MDPKDWGKSKRELQEPCEYCTTVAWETPSPYDRGKLIDKKELTRSTVVNGTELLSLEYHIGYFTVKERKNINYCPMCGRKLEENDGIKNLVRGRQHEDNNRRRCR